MSKMLKFQTIYSHGSKYLTRLIIGRFRLHFFHRGDLDEHLHSHPFSFYTFPLRSYVEETVGGYRKVKAFRLHKRSSEFVHRVTSQHKVVTLVWTSKRVSSWGFLVNGKLVDYKEYLNVQDN